VKEWERERESVCVECRLDNTIPRKLTPIRLPTLFSLLSFIHLILIWLCNSLSIYFLISSVSFTSSFSGFKIINTHFTKMSSPQHSFKDPITPTHPLVPLPPKRGEVKRRIFKSFVSYCKVGSFKDSKLKRTQTSSSFSSSDYNSESQKYVSDDHYSG
jgi:hypothetical protein